MMITFFFLILSVDSEDMNFEQIFFMCSFQLCSFTEHTVQFLRGFIFLGLWLLNVNLDMGLFLFTG